MNPTNTISVIETESFWKSHHERFKLTNLSKDEYARRNNLLKHRFIYWAHKFEKALKKSSAVKSDFIPITIKQSGSMLDKSMSVLCTVELGNGKQLWLHSEVALKLCLDAWR